MIHDPNNLEGGDKLGLGLLDISTTLVLEKLPRRCEIKWQENTIQAYEIHHGHSQAGPKVQSYLTEGLGWQQENIIGTYLHGLFADTNYRHSFLKPLGFCGTIVDWSSIIDKELDRVAELVAFTGCFSGKN